VLATLPGLAPADLEALADLERRTVQVDGGRLKLEWGVLRARSHARADAAAGGDVREFLWWEGGRLLGFAGLYAFGSSTVEVAGMVDPAARRRGVATELLDAVLARCRVRGDTRLLLVTPRSSVAGREFARRVGGVLDHSEHALVLTGEPVDGPEDPAVTLRPATRADVPDLSRVLTAAFGSAPGDHLDQLSSDSTQTLVVQVVQVVQLVQLVQLGELADAAPPEPVTVGVVRLTRDGPSGGVYGFAVDPAWQGRGIGRDVLRRVCRQLRSSGAHQVGLEVAVENEHALGLYTSLGFTRVTTEDYDAVTVS